MTTRHVLLLLAAAAVALCATVGIRALDDGAPDEDPASITPAASAPPPVMRAAPTPTPAPMSTEERPPTPEPNVEPVPETAPRTGLDEAWVAARRLAQLLRTSRTLNEELLAALTEVQRHYLVPRPPPGRMMHAPPPGGSPQERRVMFLANLKPFAEEHGWPDAHLREVQRYRKFAQKQFLKALKLQKLRRGTERNIREDVNVRAAQVLGSTGDPELSDDVIRALERTIFKAKYEVSQALYDETFGALAQLGDPDAFVWLRKEFTHSKSSPPSHVDRLSAAHRAMRRFDRDKVEGSERYKLVQEMIKTYAGVESAAAQSGGDDRARTMWRLWDRIGKDAILVVRHYAYDPLDSDGTALATMAEFQAWFRDHKNPKKPPWKND